MRTIHPSSQIVNTLFRKMETGLEGQRVLVTGASGGIGAACVELFAAEGARVVVHYHRRPCHGPGGDRGGRRGRPRDPRARPRNVERRLRGAAAYPATGE